MSQIPGGTEVAETLKTMNEQGKIVYGDLGTNARATYNPQTDRIYVNLDVDQAHLSGRLAHEGIHKVWADKGLLPSIAQERAGFDAGYALDSRLGLRDAYNPSTAEIRQRYHWLR